MTKVYREAPAKHGTLCTFLCFSLKRLVFTLDLLIFDPLFQTLDAHFPYSKNHLDELRTRIVQMNNGASYLGGP